ncbi:DUF2059 domain-containing protein [Sphingomonas sp. PB2P19]|uniref:DUF2059 domain-containing protein n=1 Tax=Sphingomonas rhamnosi TaxID=3096156 RepID=UPI002FC58511
MMRQYLAALLLASAGFPVVAHAQVAPAPAAALDPARLAVARELIDLLMPPATRAQLVENMMTPMLTNMRQGMAQNPDFAKAMGDDPRVKTLFDQFMARQQTRTMDLMRTSLPGMSDAMARAYARRFDVAQMRDLKTFFMTPSGRAYTQQSYTIMSDPDIGAWQRTMMTDSMGHMQSDIADFAKQVAALQEKKK